jgi:hypothetical protein
VAETYDAISTQTLTGTAASITFSSIPGSYTDLAIVTSGTNSTNVSFKLQFNSDTASNYSVTYLYGDGSNATGGRGTSATSITAMGRVSTSVANSLIHVMNYSNTTTYKTVIGRGSESSLTIAATGLWRNTSAITSITMTPESGTLQIGCTFSLYGIKAA